MDLDIDLYFWLVDRGVYDDDQRNKVDLERNKVRMHREHSQRLENGYYIAKLMMILKKSVVKIARKPFSLDPNLANMKDNITSTSKQMNWNVIVKELKKFGIKIESDIKAKIIEGRAQLICEILAKLFEFDNGGGPGRLAEGSSEIGPGEREQSIGAGQNESTNISIDGKQDSSSILLGLNSAKRKELEPLSPSARIGGARKSKLPSNILGSPSIRKVKGVNQSVTSLNEINEGKDLSDTETTLEFILLSLSKNLGIKPKQAAGLLSNNHKYLIHIAVKGMKGNDYSKMQQWYANIYGYSKHLTSLIEQEKDQNAMKLTLNILKCGLYSQSSDIVVTCARVLSKMAQEINMTGGQLAGLAWDWFVKAGSNNGSSTQSMNGSSDDNMSGMMRDISPPGIGIATGGVQPQKVLNESGLASCLHAMKKNQSDAIEIIAPVIIHFGRNNYIEFFNYHLRQHFTGEKQRLNFILAVHDIVMAVAGSSMFYDSLINSGALDELISQAIRMADFDPNGNNFPAERVAAISFLADVWEVKADRIEENHEVAQAILTVLKRGCRDKSRILRTVCFEQMFKLLHHFSLNRNQFAPIIYKSLTFLLIEFFQHVEIREHLIRHFVSLYQQVQTIPVGILCEPLLKQIAITGAQNTEFNIFDFEFFGVVANHKRSNVSIGLQIIDTMVAQATTQIYYANSATSIVLEIVHRFSRDQQLHQHLSKICESLVKELEESERYKKQNSAALTLGESISPSKGKGRANRNLALESQNTEQQSNALARKMKERLIVNFLKQLILFGVELIKEDLRTQLLRSYAKLENSSVQTKVKQPKSLHYLLQLFRSGNQDPMDIPQMLQYFVEQEKSKSGNKKQSQKALLTSAVILDDPTSHHLDDYLLDPHTSHTEEQTLISHRRELPLTKAQLHLEKAMRDIEKIKNMKNERKDRTLLEDELKKVKDEQIKVVAKKQVEKRLIEHGHLPHIGTMKKGGNQLGNMTRGISVDQRQMHGGGTNQQNFDKDGQPLEIRIIRARDIDDLSEINPNPNTSMDHNNRRLSILPDPNVSGTLRKGNNPVLKELKECQLYDLRLEEQKDQDAVRFFVKKYLKILRNLFNKYANTSGPINQSHLTFEEQQSKNKLMTIAEAMKMLKDFQISTLQANQKDIMSMIRAINKDIIKKKGASQTAAANTTLDFEGFVEFLMQLAVHLYSFDSAMTPSEYLQKLFDHFREAATKTNSNLLKLFQANAEEGVLVSGVLDNKLIAELNKRLQQNPDYPLPDGYHKVTEKEIVNSYHIPDYFPVSDSQRVCVETLDGFLSDLFGFHILEPMAETLEHVRVRPILKQVTKDKVMSEITLAGNKNAMPTIKARSSRPDKVGSHSIDVRPAKNLKLTSAMTRDNSRAEVSKNQLLKNQTVDHLFPKPPLGVVLKLEIARRPQDQRSTYLEAAFALEEMLQSLEKGESILPRHNKGGRKPTNKIIEERQKKAEQEERSKVSDRLKLEERKKMLKEQLDKMKVEKDKKTKEEEAKKKIKDQKLEEKKKKRNDKLQEDLNKLKTEFAEKREKKHIQEQEKKAADASHIVDPVTKKLETQKQLQLRKQNVIEELQRKAEEMKDKKRTDEETKQRKIDSEKSKASQVKKMYEDTKNKARELKERFREDYQQFRDSDKVKYMFQQYDKAIQQMFEQYSKFDGVLIGKGEAITMSYNAYMKMGQKLGLFPSIVSSQDYVYIYKTMMKVKKQNERESGVKYESIIDVQGTRLNLQEFKEALFKMACLGKFKLGGGPEQSEEEVKIMKDQEKQRIKQALAGAAASGVLKRPKEEYEDGNVNEDYLNLFEKEFDVADMTEKTIENLFKSMNLKPDKPGDERKGGKMGRSKASPEKIGGGGSPSRLSRGNSKYRNGGTLRDGQDQSIEDE